ncbi:MAG: adenylyl-sulfate kinase [Bacteroidetes bacterium]|nr:MAG: adenylyl-sulfate kinase [Bacteroidota bacterium]MBL1143342.1 adenylyl-sulfate kinase [Bacteroidota bacterium]NOG56144.1 adenylyl-sulfate kinase [Bacteroidota bacterium]
MKNEGRNIYSVFDEMLPKSAKENLLQQHAKVLWMTGLSGSGKTTIAKQLEKILHEKGYLTQLLDGDNIRAGINNNLGFSDADRIENIRRIAEISKLFLNCGIITINCFVSPTEEIRRQAKEIIGEENFIEVFINTPLSVCETRDVKGLYKKARAGEIKDFTGISAPFEAPISPEISVKTENKSVEESTEEIINYLIPLINYKA